jgi:hypothetical protein
LRRLGCCKRKNEPPMCWEFHRSLSWPRRAFPLQQTQSTAFTDSIKQGFVVEWTCIVFTIIAHYNHDWWLSKRKTPWLMMQHCWTWCRICFGRHSYEGLEENNGIWTQFFFLVQTYEHNYIVGIYYNDNRFWWKEKWRPKKVFRGLKK